MLQSLARFFCVVFLLVQMSQPFAQVVQVSEFFQLAQLDSASNDGGIDLDPPQVDHIPVASGVAGSAQSLSVKAVDVQGISSVTLLHRANPDDEYKRVLMRQVSGTDNFTVSIDLGIEQRLIEYYFLVIDVGGNKVLNGFPYEPFSRILTEPKIPIEESKPVEAQNAPPQNPPEVSTTTEQMAQNKTALLWVALGVLAIGAIAASSGGGEGTPTSSGETVPVILNVPLPD